MKKYILTLVLLVAPLAFVQGCKSPTQQKLAVTTLASVHDTVDAAYKAYVTTVLKGSTPTNDLPRVSAYYRNFQEIFAVAVLSVNASTNAPVPQAVFDAQARLINAVSVKPTK